MTTNGSAATGDSWRAFRPHLGWAAIAIGSMWLGVVLGHHYPSLYVWAAITVLVTLSPVVHLEVSRLAARGSGRYAVLRSHVTAAPRQRSAHV